MDYLYGEMPPDERPDFEAWLEQHPEAKQELDALQQTRTTLAMSIDEVPAPLVVELPREQRIPHRWWARAAAVAILLVAGWLLNFQLQIGEKGLTLSLGEAPAVTPQTIASEPASAQNETPVPLTVDHQQMEQKLHAMDSIWQTRFAGLQHQQQNQWRQWQQQQRIQLAGMQQEFTRAEWPRLAGLMQQLQLEQQEELRLLISELWETWQQTRQTDLKAIDSRMTLMYQNVERNQLEAEARFVNYLQTVGD